MAFLIVVILLIAALTGTLWTVLEIAAGVMLGIFFALVLLAVVGFLFLRSRIRRLQRELHERYGRRYPS